MTIEKKPPVSAKTGPDARVRSAELFISAILRAGVFAAVTVIAVGAALSLIRHPEFITSHRALYPFKADIGAFPHTFRSIAQGLLQLHGQAFAALGLLILILTPVARVGASILIFLALRDRLYTMITSIVFALLIVSFVVGAGFNH